MSRCVRIGVELYDRMGVVADALRTDRAEVARRALRRVQRVGFDVVRAENVARTTGDVVRGHAEARTTPLRLVDLGGLDEGLSGEDIRAALEWAVPVGVKRRGPDVVKEAGFAFRRDGSVVGGEARMDTDRTDRTDDRSGR